MLIFLMILIAVPSLSLFIFKCYEPLMILRRFYLFLTFIYMKNWRKKDRWKRNIVKPFMCIYCFNTWLSILFYFIFISNNILFLPLFIGLTYIMLEMYLKIIDFKN